MIVIGNILLAFAAIIYIVLLSAAYGPEPSSAGDAAGGYAMSVILFSLVFAVCMVLSSVIIGWKGGFAWLPGSGAARFAWVVVGLAAIMIVSALATILKFEPAQQVPLAVRPLTGIAPALFPLVLLLAGFVLLNPSIRESASPLAYKIPLGIVFGISAVACAGCLLQWMQYKDRRATERIAEIRSDEARYHDQRLLDIENTDPMTHLANLLSFTGRYQDADVREKALAKIKTNPEWQQELVRLLDTKAYYLVFTFLDANEVEDKALFPEALNRSIQRMAQDIRQYISDSNHLNDWSLDHFNTERMLSAADQFRGMGVDFLPAVRQVRAAFDEMPQAHVKKPKFKQVKILDRWIKDNS